MKKSIIRLCSFLCCLTIFLTSVNAGFLGNSERKISYERIDLEDGGYIIVEIEESEIQLFASKTKSGTKTATRYTSSNSAVFSVVVTGTFTYDGSTSQATSSSATVNIHNTSATYVSKSANYSGNTATATGKVKYGGITYPLTVSLSCSATGVLS